MPARSKLLSLVAAAGLLLGACQAQVPTTNLSPDNPVVQIPEGLALSVRPADLPAGFGAQLSAVPAETLAQGEGDWAAARAALPGGLRLVSPVYQVRTTGPLPLQLFLSVILPSGAAASLLDLYGWDGQAWSFMPARHTAGQLVAAVAQPPLALGLFTLGTQPPMALISIEPGETLTAGAASAVNELLLGGVRVQANGALSGQLPNTPRDSALAYIPIIRNFDPADPSPAALAPLLGDVTARANHVHALASFAAAGSFDGLALDYRGLASDEAPIFTQFAAELAARLRADGRRLYVFVPPVDSTGLGAGGYATGAYDWRALGQAADALLLRTPDQPAAFGDGTLDAMLGWAVGEVSRGRLRLVTSALSVEAAGDQLSLKDQRAALATLGAVTLVTANISDTNHYPGQPITVTLSGQIQDLAYDAAALATRYTYADEAGATRSVWLTTAETLRGRLALAERYRLGGAVVSGLLTRGVPEDLAGAITEYKVSRAAETLPAPELLWTVSDASGVLAQATAQPGQPYVYVADRPGQYQIAAGLQNGSRFPLGAAEVGVTDVTPTPTPRPRGSGSTTGGFVPPPPVALGGFELGGQVPGYISHAAQMKQAGMTWVKFQAIDPAGSIASGKAAGFKVLISAVGDIRRAADPAYWPEYAAWTASIAALGADAIEIWNEANLDREWPNGQISGRAYTEMLRQAYLAIKAVNPNTIVISGAPAPTGAAGSAGCTAAFCNDDVFLAEMAAAGAANYADCIGVHFNSGTTSPNVTTGSALSGYHYSFYFWPMVDLYHSTFGGSRPLCFTELGYVSPEGYESIPLPAYFQWAADTSVAEQAQWLAESASLAASSGKVRMMIVFNVDFTHYLPNDPQAGYAILRPGGGCPACDALDAVMP